MIPNKKINYSHSSEEDVLLIRSAEETQSQTFFHLNESKRQKMLKTKETKCE